MGFFDSLLRAIKGTTHSNNTENKRTDRVARPSQTAGAGRPPQMTLVDLTNRIRDILQSEYPQYQVREKVDIRNLDETQEFGGPIDFALFSEGKIVGAVMLIDYGQKRTNRIYGVELACAKTGVGFANFYVQFNDSRRFPFSRKHAIAYLKRQIQ